MKRNGHQNFIGRDRWYRSGVPGLIGIGVVVAARLAGLLQPLEWAALDAGLRWRLPEPTDERVVIVGITEADIQAIGAYPIPDAVLAQLLQQLQTYEPQVIGLDLVRDLPVEPGHADLAAAFRSMNHVIGAESIVPDRAGATIDPPSALPADQIGFVDSVLDADGNLRRSLLGSPTLEGGYQFSMAVRLAMTYLEQYDIELDNGIYDQAAMRFSTVELPRIHPNSGGYVRADTGGNQTLLNFRSGATPFRIVSLTDVLSGQVNPEWFHDRVVLIGVMASSAKDIVQSSAVVSSNPGLVFGVEVQAHATSQIISAVMDGRSLLSVWPDSWEYAWIMVWGLVGIGYSHRIQRPSRHFFLVGITSVGLIGLGYICLLNGLWLPIVPALVALLLNGVVLHGFYLYNHSLQSRIRDRQLVIEQTFSAIHNGPLQTLATLMRDTDNPDFSQHTLRQNLQQLNQELRRVYDAIQQEVAQDDRLYLQGQSSLDLTAPLHELLYEVYHETLRRDFHNFKALKVKVIKFEPFDETGLSPELKRNLCRFLEEALCNVGKHAVGAKRLIVDCWYDGTCNIIRIVDNGVGMNQANLKAIDLQNHAPRPCSSQERGTQQAAILAKQINGTFERSSNSPQGTVCELRWQPKQTPFQHIKKKIIAVFGKLNG